MPERTIRTEDGDGLVRVAKGAREAYREGQRLINAARVWAAMVPYSESEAVMRADADERAEAVREMELSLYTNLALLMMGDQNHDRELALWRDGGSGASFYWRHASGYEGGLIFHRSHKHSPNVEDVLVGTWSLHT